MKKILVLLALVVSSVFANGISWKTFDVKLGPTLSGYGGYHATGIGLNLQVVKPFTPNIGAGIMVDVGAALGGCEDCDSYDFKELYEGVLLNFNYPIAKHFGLVSNFMFGVSFRDGTYTEGGFMDPPVVTIRKENGEEESGILIAGYNDYEESDYYTESFQFRSNLGLNFYTSSKRFGVEFFPLDFAIDRIVRFTFSINAVVRIF